MIEGRISPAKVLRISRFVIVTKLVMITSSLGIIIRERNRVNIRFLPGKDSLAKAKAANVITITMIPVVTIVKNRVFPRYRASGTEVNASL